MKTTLRWALVPGALLVLACQDRLPGGDLAADLALLDAASLELAPALGASAEVISAAGCHPVGGILINDRIPSTPTFPRN